MKKLSEKTTHSINLYVTTGTPEKWDEAFSKLTNLARSMGPDFPSVSVSSVDTSILDDDSDVADDLYYDDNTLRKVYTALETIDLRNIVIEDIVNAILNAGIVFRERR